MASEPVDGRFLFAGIEIGGPLEELEAVFAKKFRTCDSLGDREGAERLARAFDLARSRLEAAMRLPGGPAAG